MPGVCAKGNFLVNLLSSNKIKKNCCQLHFSHSQALELRRTNQQPSANQRDRVRATLRPASTHDTCRSPGPELERKMKELRTFNNRFRRTLQAKENELQVRCVLCSVRNLDRSSSTSNLCNHQQILLAKNLLHDCSGCIQNHSIMTDAAQQAW